MLMCAAKSFRAVVRTGLDRGWEVFGVRHGFAGLIAGDLVPLGARDVGGIIQRGGTMLGSTRCPEFKNEAAREQALDELQQRGVNGLIVIGGNGSQTGSHALAQMGFPVVGEVVANRKPLDLRLLELAGVLAK